MKIDMRVFAGELPRVGVTAPLNLPERNAHSCQNTKLTSSSIRPFGDLRRVWTVTKTPPISTIYRFASQQGNDREGAVAQVQATTPIRIVSSTAHGLLSGRRVYVAGTGVSSIDDQEFQVTVINPTTFSLDGTSASSTSTTGRWTSLTGFWFHWPAHVHVVRGQIPGDTQERTYFTGDGVPKMTYAGIATAGGNQYPTNAYDLGVPVPDPIPTVTLTGDPDEGVQEIDRRTVYYVVTYVTELGEEGPPCDPTTTVEWSPGQEVSITDLPTGPMSGNFNITTKRIYRVDTADGMPMFVADVALAATSYVDTMGPAGEVIPSLLWDMPPPDMKNLGVLASGVHYGISRNRLCLSEPYLPHAWPAIYQRPANHDFVAAGHFDSTIVAVTQEQAYVAQGYDPRSTQLVDSIEQGCVSARSMVSIPGLGAAYASPDGLILIGPGGPMIATDQYLSRDEWQALNPASIHGYAHDGFYVGFHTRSNGLQGGFIFDPREGGIGWVPISVYATAGFRDALTDALYLVIGNRISRWDSEQNEPIVYRWRSKPFRLFEFTPNAARVVANTYNNLVFRVLSGNTPVFIKTVTSSRPFRLGIDRRHPRLSFEVEGVDYCERIAVADAIEDLESV